MIMKRIIIATILASLISTSSMGVILIEEGEDTAYVITYVGQVWDSSYFLADAYSLYGDGNAQYMGSGLAFVTTVKGRTALKISIFDNVQNYGWNTEGYYIESDYNYVHGIAEFDGAFCCSWNSHNSYRIHTIPGTFGSTRLAARSENLAGNSLAGNNNIK